MQKEWNRREKNKSFSPLRFRYQKYSKKRSFLSRLAVCYLFLIHIETTKPKKIFDKKKGIGYKLKKASTHKEYLP